MVKVTMEDTTETIQAFETTQTCCERLESERDRFFPDDAHCNLADTTRTQARHAQLTRTSRDCPHLFYDTRKSYNCRISLFLTPVGLRRTSIPRLARLDFHYMNTSCLIHLYKPLMADRQVSGVCLQTELADIPTVSQEKETKTVHPRPFPAINNEILRRECNNIRVHVNVLKSQRYHGQNFKTTIKQHSYLCSMLRH